VVEAIGRFVYQSPGCRQGTILAPVAAWRQLLPSSGTVSAEDAATWLRHVFVTSDATDSDAAGIDSSGRDDASQRMIETLVAQASVS
jgi:hypothetical protein